MKYDILLHIDWGTTFLTTLLPLLNYYYCFSTVVLCCLRFTANVYLMTKNGSTFIAIIIVVEAHIC